MEYALGAQRVVAHGSVIPDAFCEDPFGNLNGKHNLINVITWHNGYMNKGIDAPGLKHI